MRRALLLALGSALVLLVLAPNAGAVYTGWPVRPVHRQHPIRGSFLDPRGHLYHEGVDISVNDDRPEAGHPPGRTHRVYAVESGRVYNVVDSDVTCPHRNFWIGRFRYYHVDAVVTSGQEVSAGQMIGWTCLGMWHVHLGELVNGVYVNPLRAGSILRPYVDTARPAIHALSFYNPTTGAEVDASALHGVVDARGWIDDPQSFHGWFQGEYAILYTPLHPWRVRITLRRLATGAIVLRRNVFVASTIPTIPISYHYAPGTRRMAAQECLELRFHIRPDGCRTIFWFHLWATPFGRYWDTRAYPNGDYRLTVGAWDTKGNARVRSVDVTVRN